MELLKDAKSKTSMERPWKNVRKWIFKKTKIKIKADP